MRVLMFPEDEMRLRRKAEDLPSDAFNTEPIRQLAEVLAATLEGIDNVDVLASTQLAFDPPWALLALKGPKGISILCNPRVRTHSGESFELGACASFAGVPERLLCPMRLTVEFRRLDGMLREQECGASGARAVWQGIDSLRGKLFSDRMSPIAQKPGFFQKVRRQRTMGRT